MSARRKAPNVVVVQGEGHGWGSLPVPMDPRQPEARRTGLKMPHFETLARDGMRFARFYAASPRCTPSRAALLTGRSPAALGMTFVGEGRRDQAPPSARLLPPPTVAELPERETTIAEALRDRGFATAHFGKWHVGRAAPSRHGFAAHDGANANGGPEDDDDPDRTQMPLIRRRVAAFLDEQLRAGRPFYLQIDQYASRADSAQEEMDRLLGEIQAALRERRADADTWTFYTTDHGTPGRNLPLRGGKGHLAEGGIRVPFLARGPGVTPGAVCHVPASTLDLFPTILALTDTPAPPGEREGGSLLPLLRGGGTGAVARPREGLFFHFPHYDHDNGGPASAVILGDWKLVRSYENGADRLYDLRRDPGERDDLAPRDPARAEEMGRRLTDHLRAVGARLPTANPAYDPDKPADSGTRRGRGARGGRP